MEIIFRTDGVREEYTSPEVGYRVGLAAAQVLSLPEFVIVQDTRPFNPVLADALKQGLVTAGAEVLDLGILPTSAAAITASAITREDGIPCGAISLSASHNLAKYFGIKVSGVDGKKLDDATNRQLEHVANGAYPSLPLAKNYADGSLAKKEFYQRQYIDYLVNARAPMLDEDFLLGSRIILDPANGAAFKSAQEALRLLGADVIVINADPAGEINRNCGAEHPGVMVAAAKQAERLGFAMDGDADRLITSTPQGRMLDGDHSIHIGMIALDLLGCLGVRRYVSTKYSNFGLRYSLAHHGIAATEVINGDREVAQAMSANILIGGERSGHTLYNGVADRANRVLSGDATVTAIQLLSAVALTGLSLDQLAAFKPYPHLEQKLTDLKGDVFNSVVYLATKARVDAAQGEEGDNLGRMSGTERGIGRLLVRDIKPDRAAWAMENLMAAALA